MSCDTIMEEKARDEISSNGKVTCRAFPGLPFTIIDSGSMRLVSSNNSVVIPPFEIKACSLKIEGSGFMFGFGKGTGGKYLFSSV